MHTTITFAVLQHTLTNLFFHFRSAEPLNYRDKNNLEIVNLQIGTLKLISTNVNNAYNGLEVDLENNRTYTKMHLSLALVLTFNISSSTVRHKKNGDTVAGTLPEDDEISGSGDHSGSGDSESSTQVEHIVESSTPSDALFFSSTMSTAATEQVGPVVPKKPSNSTISKEIQPSSAHFHPPLLALLLGALLLHALRPC